MTGNREAVTMPEHILNAALRLFMDKGYVNTSMDEIADAVGLTKGGLYHYVEKKEDLLVGIHDQMLDALLKRVGDAIAPEAEPVEQLRMWIREYARVVKEYQAHVKIFFTEINHFPKALFNRTAERRDLVVIQLRRILADAVSTGKVAGQMDPVVVSFLILGMANWLFIWYRPDGRFSIDDVIATMEKLLFDGLVVKDPAVSHS